MNMGRIFPGNTPETQKMENAAANAEKKSNDGSSRASLVAKKRVESKGKALSHKIALWTPAAAILVFLLAATYGIGITVDEGVYISFSRDAVEWLIEFIQGIVQGEPGRALGRSALFEYWAANKEHPSIMKWIGGFSYLMFSPFMDAPASYRLGFVLLFMATLYFIYRFMSREFSFEAGLFSALSVLFIPCIFGYSHLVVMDFVVAAFGIMAAFSWYWGTNSRKWSILSGLFIGLALASKINAFFFIPPLIVWSLLFTRKKSADNLFALLLLAPIVFILSWPWLYHNTFARILDYLTYHLHHEMLPEYYFGRIYNDPSAPWHYPFVMFALKTPLTILASLILGIFSILKIKNHKIHLRSSLHLLLFFNFLIPMLVLTPRSIPKYDGPRLFLSSFLYAGCLAGLGLSWFYRNILKAIAKTKKPIRPNLILALLAVVVYALPFYDIITLHPYEPFSFWSRLIGGLKGAQKAGLESNDWGNVPPEAVHYLNRTLPPNSSVYNNTGAYEPLRNYHIFGMLRKDIRFTSVRADYLLLEINQSWSDWEPWWDLYFDRSPEYELVKSFRRRGVPLLNLYKRRP